MLARTGARPPDPSQPRTPPGTLQRSPQVLLEGPGAQDSSREFLSRTPLGALWGPGPKLPKRSFPCPVFDGTRKHPSWRDPFFPQEGSEGTPRGPQKDPSRTPQKGPKKVWPAKDPQGLHRSPQGSLGPPHLLLSSKKREKGLKGTSRSPVQERALSGTDEKPLFFRGPPS